MSQVIQSPVKRFNEYVKKLYDSGQEEFGCAYECGSMISRKHDVGGNDIGIDFDVGPDEFPAFYHRECCLCQTDQRKLNGRWLSLEIYSDNEYVGSLFRCPLCFRVFDDDGQEVNL